jgi:hypothetical protein
MTSIAPAKIPIRRSSAMTYGYFTAGTFVFVTEVLDTGVETAGVSLRAVTGDASGIETAGCLFFFFLGWNTLPRLGFFGI